MPRIEGVPRIANLNSTRITEYPYGVLRQADNRGGWLSIKLLWHNVVICEGWVAGIFAPGQDLMGGWTEVRACTAPHQCPTLRVEQSKGASQLTIDHSIGHTCTPYRVVEEPYSALRTQHGIQCGTRHGVRPLVRTMEKSRLSKIGNDLQCALDMSSTSPNEEQASPSPSP